MELTDDGARRPGLTPAPNDPRKLRDMLLVVVVCAAVALALVAVDAVDHIYHALAARDATALLVGLILIPIGVSVFAFRRFQAAEEVWKETARLSMRDAAHRVADPSLPEPSTSTRSSAGSNVTVAGWRCSSATSTSSSRSTTPTATRWATG